MTSMVYKNYNIFVEYVLTTFNCKKYERCQSLKYDNKIINE